MAKTAKNTVKLSSWEKTHLKQLALVEKKIAAAYDELCKKAGVIGALNAGKVSPDKAFSLADYPDIRKQIDNALRELSTNVQVTIVDGVRAQWSLAEDKNDALCEEVLGSPRGKLPEALQKRYFAARNTEAVNSFIKRKEGGLNLSQRVWKYAKEAKVDIESALEIGIKSGQPASAIARDLKRYLQEPKKLFRRVRDEEGVLHLSSRAKEYHPGQGVYRSSYKNALRLAATECNMAYRESDYERWQQLDFVVGIEVKLSNNHTLNGRPFTDICDDLAGRYPKTFKFRGWHPFCRCHAVSILKTNEEIMADNKRILEGKEPLETSVNSVTEMPEGFNEWVSNNKERAKGWSSMPDFIKQNPQYVQGFEVDTYTKAERKFTRARKTSEAMKESLDIFLQAKYPELPNTEKAAIYHYTKGEGAAFRQLNNQLRKGNLSEFNAAFAELISQGLSKLETTTETVYRTIRLNKTNLDGFLDLAKQNGISVFSGFTSASLDRQTVVDFAAKHTGRKNNETDVLLVIQGKSGHPIEDLSQFSGRFEGKPNQREVLFDRGCKFRFDKVESEEGAYVFYLTEV